MGTQPHQIADAVRLIMSQRLIPRLCPICRKSRKATEVEIVRIKKMTGVTLNPNLHHTNHAATLVGVF
jgi:type II secretory ATPase GspE/PulE/Tfp pilus assembly ATPase PilB-like protein